MNVNEYLKDFTEEAKTKFWDDYYNRETIYKEAMAQYKLDHECCPECGETGHISTLVGYMFNHEHPESYMDKNNCTCSLCGDVHIMHERVPKQS